MSVLKIDSKLPISGEDIKYEHLVHLFDKNKLREVNILHLNNTQINSIPKSIGLFKHLTELYLSNNQLTSIPPEIIKIPNLEKLYIDNNKLESIPS